MMEARITWKRGSMPSIRVHSPRELNLPKEVEFWYPRTTPRDFKIDHIQVKTCPNPDAVEVRLYDSPDGEAKEVWYAPLGRSAISQIPWPKPKRRLTRAGS